MEMPETDRIAFLFLRYEELLGLMTGKHRLVELPDDAQIVDMDKDLLRRGFTILVRSAEFEPIPFNCVPPMLHNRRITRPSKETRMFDYPNHPHRAGQTLDPDDPPMRQPQPAGKATETIQLALDTLGSALADHGHQWTSEERQLYERATALLRRDPRQWS